MDDDDKRKALPFASNLACERGGDAKNLPSCFFSGSFSWVPAGKSLLTSEGRGTGRKSRKKTWKL